MTSAKSMLRSTEKKFIKKVTVFLTVENHEYMRRKCFEGEKSKSYVINEIMDHDRLGQSATQQQ